MTRPPVRPGARTTRWAFHTLRAIIGFGSLGACKPDLGDPASLVTEPRILAVRSERAESPPDQAVTYRALIAVPGATPGGMVSPNVAWGFCVELAPLSSNNVVNDGCIADATSLPDRGLEIHATIPLDACSAFGPTPPAPPPGQPPRRPHDVDVTGGYYEPIRAVATLDDGSQLAPGIGLTRLTCDLANAPFDVVMDFRARYHANQNPTLVSVVAEAPTDGGPHDLTTPLPSRTKMTLRADWTPDSVESFPVFDPASRTLVDHREAIRVSWFVSGGELASDRTGRGKTETETFADDIWTTPEPGLPVGGRPRQPRRNRVCQLRDHDRPLAGIACAYRPDGCAVSPHRARTPSPGDPSGGYSAGSRSSSTMPQTMVCAFVPHLVGR
jgi:hypothetical protein